MNQFGQRVGQSPGTHVMDRQDGVVVAKLPAVIDDLLRAALDLGVGTLHRIEVEVGGIGSRRHGRSRSTAHADQHPGPA